MVDLSGFQPLDIATTASLVASRIREAIADGTFQSGTRLGEVQLSEALAVSRGPVREALQRLIQEGLLRDERNRGVFVVDLGSEDIEDIYAARAAIEHAAVRRLLADDNLDAEAARLGAIIDDMAAAAKADDWTRIVELDLRFHETLVAAARSSRMIRMYRTLLTETKMCLIRLESTYTHRSDLVDEHRAIVEALRGRDVPRALQVIDTHLATATRALRESFPVERPGIGES